MPPTRGNLSTKQRNFDESNALPNPCTVCWNLCGIHEWKSIAVKSHIDPDDANEEDSTSSLSSPETDKKFIIHIEIPELLKSSRNGCKVCRMLKTGIEALGVSRVDLDGIVVCNDWIDRFYVYIFPRRKTRFQTFEFCTSPESYLSWPQLMQQRWFAPGEGCGQSFSLIRSWLHNCISSHTKCRTRASRLPLRAIHVGSESVEPRLCVTNSRFGKYLALSHCWGGEVPLKTTKANFEKRIKSITYQDLPKTFQDAVYITRKLEVEYLWIDSICIIQDSPDDWAEQSADMCDIYGNSLLTIYAQSARNCHDGLISPHSILGTHKTIPDPRNPKSSILVRDIHYHPGDRYQLLDSRGWALQERIVSRRKLFCSSEEFGWECQTFSCCECRVPPYRPEGRVIKAGLSLHGRDEAINNWFAVVVQVAKREFTYSSDVLPAIAGLAQLYHRATGDEYLCGIWKNDLVRGLSWSRQGSTNKRHSEYYAPTWSWASTTGEVSWLIVDHLHDSYEDFQSYLSVVEVCCVPSSKNQYGPARSGYITVGGPCIPVRIKKDERYYGSIDEEKVLSASALSGENNGSSSILEGEVLPDICQSDEVSLDSEYLLLMGGSVTDRVERGKRVFGIVLRLSPSINGNYERVASYIDFYMEESGRIDHQDWFPLATRQTITII